MLEIPTPRWSNHWAAKLNLATESEGACLRAATSLDFAGGVHANREITVAQLIIMSVILTKDGATPSVRAEVKAGCRCLIPQPKF